MKSFKILGKELFEMKSQNYNENNFDYYSLYFTINIFIIELFFLFFTSNTKIKKSMSNKKKKNCKKTIFISELNLLL